MAWSAPRTWTTGELVTAAYMNGVRDALNESAAAKVTTAGDLVVATGANALGRLAAVASGQVLTSQGVGVAPAWASPSGPTGAAGGALAGTYPNPTLAPLSSLAIGTNPSTTGVVRLPNNDGVYFRNAANSLDFRGLFMDNANRILLGNTSGNIGVDIASSSGATIELKVGGASVLTAQGGVQIGAPASGDMGAGTLNASGQVRGLTICSFGGNVSSTTGTMELFNGATAWHPDTDNTDSMGDSSHRWTVVYATTGTINTSSREAKQDIVALAPARALDLVRATAIHTFRYRSEDDAVAAMTRVGFIAEDTDRLLSLDGKSADPMGTACLALAAIQELDRRLSAMEAR